MSRASLKFTCLGNYPFQRAGIKRIVVNGYVIQTVLEAQELAIVVEAVEIATAVLVWITPGDQPLLEKPHLLA